MFESIELAYLFLVGFFSFFLVKTVFDEKMPMYYIKLPIYIVTTVVFSIYYFNNPINYVNTSILAFFIMSVISQITVYRGYHWRIGTGFGLGIVYLLFIVSTYKMGFEFSNLQLYMLLIAIILITTSMNDNSKLEKLYIIVLFSWAGATVIHNNNILLVSFLMYAFSELILLSNMKIKERLNPELKKREKVLVNSHGEEVIDLIDWEKILTSEVDYYVNKKGAYKKQLIHDYLASSISITAHIFLSLYYVL